jgi:hypothetical protein
MMMMMMLLQMVLVGCTCKDLEIVLERRGRVVVMMMMIMIPLNSKCSYLYNLSYLYNHLEPAGLALFLESKRRMGRSRSSWYYSDLQMKKKLNLHLQ